MRRDKQSRSRRLGIVFTVLAVASLLAVPAMAKNANQPLASGSVKTVSDTGTTVQTSFKVYDNDAGDRGRAKMIIDLVDGPRAQVTFGTGACVFTYAGGIVALGTQMSYKGDPFFDAPLYIMFLGDDPDTRVTFAESIEFDLFTFEPRLDEAGDTIPITQSFIDELCAAGPEYWEIVAGLVAADARPVTNGRITIRH